MMLRPGLLLLAAMLLLAVPALGQSRQPSLYTVSDVAVDVTAQSALKARDTARLDGERRALTTLLQRLTAKEDWNRLPKASDAELEELLQDFEVAGEKTSAVRYIATFTYRFQRDAVANFLRNHGIAFAETRSKPVLVLPVLSSGGRSILWEDPNPWRAAWGQAPGIGEGLVPMRLAHGDLTDVQAIDANQAARGDRDPLTALSRAYEGVDVLVVRADVTGSGAQRAIQLTAARYAAGFPDQSWTGSVKADAGEGDDALYAKAVDAAIAGVNDAWKQSILSHGGGTNASASLVAIVPLTSLKDWVAVRERLRSISSIQRTRLLSLTKEAARVEIGYLGEPETLQIVLAQRDLTLARGDSDWTLSAKGAQPK
ncbi:MAG TPA: DUF2066 domain-containing protein [Stellaceae bacterium]|nr:DUF2066 domain-containing protein [Stellaceae bacterium]